MPSSMGLRDAWLAIPVIAGLVGGLYALCVFLVWVPGLPWDLGLPWPLRVLGAPLLALGLATIGWVLRFRGPSAVLASTYVTLRKLLRRLPVAAPGGRTEPLVVAGPYRYVRHPLYSGVIAMVFGIALLVDRTPAWLGALALFLWFEFVLAPFEERELVALFGPPYREYMAVTPRFLPWRRRPRSS